MMNKCASCKIRDRKGNGYCTPCQREYKKEWYADRPLYHTWENMRERCRNTGRKDYHLYGGKGVKVCERWANYRKFEEDMLDSYKEGYHLHRLDNDGGYCLANCKWVTIQQNNHYKPHLKRLKCRGLTNIITGWSKLVNMSVSAFKARLKKMSLEEALITPVKNQKKNYSLINQLYGRCK